MWCMKTLGLKEITFLKEKIAELEMHLQSNMTVARFDTFILTATLIAVEIDKIKPNSTLEKFVNNKELLQSRKRSKAYQILNVLKNNVQDVETTFFIENAKKYKENSNGYSHKTVVSVEKLEILKLQLDLTKQKGFYLMYQNKVKVAIQEDILTVAAHIIQELGHTKDLVYQVMKKFKGLEEFKDLDYVTKTEELVIAECYTLLFETLIDLRY